MTAQDDLTHAAHARYMASLPQVGFQAPKIPRFRDMVVTEKIDGSNAAIRIIMSQFGAHVEEGSVPDGCTLILGPDHIDWDHGDDGMPSTEFLVYAQSRKRLIKPGDDNFGFAAWVRDNAKALVSVLGEGDHYGEWWGQGIQRKYGLDEKRFSLFNTRRWDWLGNDDKRDEWSEWRVNCKTSALGGARAVIPHNLTVVPTLYTGPFNMDDIDACLGELDEDGSVAAGGFKPAEGVVIFLPNANRIFKKTLDGDGGKFAKVDDLRGRM